MPSALVVKTVQRVVQYPHQQCVTRIVPFESEFMVSMTLGRDREDSFSVLGPDHGEHGVEGEIDQDLLIRNTQHHAFGVMQMVKGLRFNQAFIY